MKENNSWNKEKQSEYYKIWRIKNKEKLKKYHEKWYQENKDHIKEYVEKNNDQIKLKQKEYRECHKEEIKEMWQKWYKEHPERSPRRRFTESRNKAIKKRNLTWTITLKEYTELIKLPCYYCANKLGEPVKRSCGLDRLDSSKGYEIFNVVSCCSICNTIKNEYLTPEETKVAIEAILKYRECKLP
jgi:hypothetical protein